MRYTVVLTEESDGNIHALVPGLPQCIAYAASRFEAINAIRKTVSEFVSRSEFVQIDVIAEPKSLLHDTPWEWFGAFGDDPTWGELFEDIECQRNL